MLAYGFGLAGLVSGGAGWYVAGGFFLSAAFGLLITVITFCLLNMRDKKQNDASEKEVARRLWESGILREYVQEFRKEANLRARSGMSQ